MLTPGTDTYATLVEANAYASALPFPGDWATATDPAKENALKTAAIWLDTLRFKGIRTTYAQVMEWPRVGMFDRDGFVVSATAIPTLVKQAQSELALRLLSEDRAADAGALVPDDLSVGSLKITGLHHSIIPASVRVLLAPFLASGSGMVSGVRG